MRTSETLGAIGGALAKAQGVMEGAAKDSTNPHFRSKYADLAAVVGACRSALAQQEIGVVQSPSTGEGAVVRMVTTLLHSSGEWIESDPLTVQAKDAGPQSVGSCLTYLRRYQLAALVGVAPEDDDAEAAEGRTPSRAAQAVATAPAGYAEWLTDLSAVVDNGIDALKAAWQQSPIAFRQFITSTNAGGWEAMKAAAEKKSDALAAPKATKRAGPQAVAS